MHTDAALADRRDALFARATNPTLIQSAYLLGAKGTDKTAEERLTLAWIHDELERRAGGTVDDDTFCQYLNAGLSYTDALLVIFPQLSA